MADGHSAGLTLVPLRGKPRHAARTGTESPSKREGSRSGVLFGSLSLGPSGVPRLLRLREEQTQEAVPHSRTDDHASTLLLCARIRVDGFGKLVQDQIRRLLHELVELLALHQPISWRCRRVGSPPMP